MRLRSLRSRTTAAALAVLFPVLLVAGVAGIWVQRADLTTAVASLAEEQARTLAADVPARTPGADPAGEEAIAQIVSLDDGQVLSSSPDAGDHPLVPAPAGPAPVHHQIRGPVPDEPDRYEVVALRSADGASYVVVARSLESVDAATASTSALLLAGGLLVLLTTGGLTWRATGRALAPVEAMHSRAASISAEELGERLPVPDSQDELGRLAATLNELLARIDAATRKERQFVADASHELRSPLATIRALLESDRLSPHPGGHAGLTEEVVAETDRLALLVDDLLRLARGDARRPVPHGPVDVSALVGAEVQRARRIPVTATIAPRLDVTGDADALGVAIRNLIDNAQRFAASEVRVTAEETGGHLVLSVADDGPGIRAQDRERVFERFVRLDDNRSRSDGGAGLGLAITRQVAEAHGGTVAVTTSHEIRGACFTMRLPTGGMLLDPRRGRTEV